MSLLLIFMTALSLAGSASTETLALTLDGEDSIISSAVQCHFSFPPGNFASPPAGYSPSLPATQMPEYHRDSERSWQPRYLALHLDQLSVDVGSHARKAVNSVAFRQLSHNCPWTLLTFDVWNDVLAKSGRSKRRWLVAYFMASEMEAEDASFVVWLDRACGAGALDRKCLEALSYTHMHSSWHLRGLHPAVVREHE